MIANPEDLAAARRLNDLDEPDFLAVLVEDEELARSLTTRLVRELFLRDPISVLEVLTGPNMELTLEVVHDEDTVQVAEQMMFASKQLQSMADRLRKR
jgi:hypothetical protein